MTKPTLRPLMVITTAFFISAIHLQTHAVEVFKCTKEDGTVAFQDLPCDTGEEEVVKVEPPEFNQETFLLGKWSVYVKPEEKTYLYEFRSNKNVIVTDNETPGQTVGTWKLEEDHVRMSWDKGKVWRTFRYPLNVEEVTGDDAEGQGILIAEKIAGE